MKNKIILILILIFISFIFQNKVFGSQDFVFESGTIEIINSQNKIIAKNGVEVLTNDGKKITAQNSEYNKDTNILILTGEVVFFDKNKKIKITSDKITYDRNKEIVLSEPLTTIFIGSSYELSGKNIIYSVSENFINSDMNASLKDKDNNKIYIEDYKYSLITQQLKTKKMNLKDKNQNILNSNFSIIDLKNNRLLSKDVNLNFNDKTFLKID